jgi:DNA-binding NarL/FixJ family response regulator
MRDGLKTVLELEEDFKVVATARDGNEACELAERYLPQVLLLDVRMPAMDGVQCIKKIKKFSSCIKIIMLTTFNDEEYIMDALADGANGYLLKDIEVEKLVEAIRDVVVGKMILPPIVALKLSEGLSKISHRKKEDALAEELNFSEREKEVSRLMVQGFSNRQIASVLYISEGTARNYISSIYEKIGIRDRTQAVLYLKERTTV